MADLSTVLADAQAELANHVAGEATLSAGGTAAVQALEAQRQATREVRAIVDGIAAVHASLQVRDAELTARADDYFSDVAAVRDALATGALSTAKRVEVATAIRTATGISTSDLSNGLAAVTTYDGTTATTADTEKTALDTALASLETHRATLVTAERAMKSAAERIDSLAGEAARLVDRAATKLAMASASMAANDPATAMLHLHDCTADVTLLSSALSLSAGTFNADDTSTSANATTLKTAWTTARDAYTDALEDFTTQQLAVIDARLAYLDKVADQERRTTLRPIDAAAAAGTAAGI